MAIFGITMPPAQEARMLFASKATPMHSKPKSGRIKDVPVWKEKRHPPEKSLFPPGLILGRELDEPPPRASIGFASHPHTPVHCAANDPAGLISYDGDGHLLTFAPTGGGKGVGPVICNAVTHAGAPLVIDPKGEVYRATARRRRQMGQKVYVLDLRDGYTSDALNPLDLAALGGSETAAIARSFAAELIERPPDERERFWNDSAETVITGGCTWLLDDCDPKERNLARLYDLFAHEDPTYEIACLLDRKVIKSRVAVSAFGSFLNLPDTGTRPSVLATVLTHLRLFDSDLVRRVTSNTTVDLAGFIAGAPVTVYIIVPPARLNAYRPLLRTWISGLLFALMQRDREPLQRTLFLCDELGNLGKIDALVTAFTLIRSAGVSFWGFLQNPAQLAIYGSQQRTILDNAGVIQVFGARNRQMAADYAALVGGDADTIMHMGKDEQMLLIEGGSPQKARRLRYFAEPELAGLHDSPSPAAARSRT